MYFMYYYCVVVTPPKRIFFPLSFRKSRREGWWRGERVREGGRDINVRETY